MAELGPIFEQSRGIMAAHADQLQMVAGQPDNYYLNSRRTDRKGRTIFFGAVRLGKSYVSHHLMPIYCCPTRQDSISPALKKRQQGKSCANFTRDDPALCRELAGLTARALAGFWSAGMA